MGPSSAQIKTTPRRRRSARMPRTGGAVATEPETTETDDKTDTLEFKRIWISRHTQRRINSAAADAGVNIPKMYGNLMLLGLKFKEMGGTLE